MLLSYDMLFYTFLRTIFLRWHAPRLFAALAPSLIIFFCFLDALSLEIAQNACNRDHRNRLCQGPALP